MKVNFCGVDGVVVRRYIFVKWMDGWVYYRGYRHISGMTETYVCCCKLKANDMLF